MISKIIRKEKEHQDFLLRLVNASWSTMKLDSVVVKYHKQSLINLKEHLELQLSLVVKIGGTNSEEGEFLREREAQLKEDIQELNKMIKKYDRI